MLLSNEYSFFIFNMTNQITFEDWKKLELKIGEIKSAERVPNSDKLYKLEVDIGDKVIQVVSGIVPYYSEDELVGTKIVVLTNLKPTKFKGVESNGMLLAAGSKEDDTCVLLTPLSDIDVGTTIN